MPAGYLPTPLKELGLPQDSIVGTILRAGDALVPGGEDLVEGGDRLLMCCTDAAVAQVRDMFSSVSS